MLEEKGMFILARSDLHLSNRSVGLKFVVSRARPAAAAAAPGVCIVGWVGVVDDPTVDGTAAAGGAVD